MAKAAANKVIPIELNRVLFQKWCDGVLLERDYKGKCLVLDGSDFAKQCEAAEKAMDAGAVIYLTDARGKRSTKMYYNGKGYIEARLEYPIIREKLA